MDRKLFRIGLDRRLAGRSLRTALIQLWLKSLLSIAMMMNAWVQCWCINLARLCNADGREIGFSKCERV